MGRWCSTYEIVNQFARPKTFNNLRYAWGGDVDRRTRFHRGIYLNHGKILDSTYTKSDLEHIAANAILMNFDEIIKLFSLIKYFKNLFDGYLVEWDT